MCISIKTSFLGAKIDSGISEGNQGEEDSAQFDDNLNKNNNMALMIPQSPNSSVSVSQNSIFIAQKNFLTSSGKVTKYLSNENSQKWLSVAKLKARSEASRQKF